MEINLNNLNNATFIGIDAHTTQHTALAINRFEDEKGDLTFENTGLGINKFLSWIPKMDKQSDNVIIGIEGGDWNRHALLTELLTTYLNVYEVNPLYTKQRRDMGPRRDKSDKIDAKLIASVLTRKLSELPKITQSQVASKRWILRKTVWHYEEKTGQGAKLKNQLQVLERERKLTKDKSEQSVLDTIIHSNRLELKRITRLKQVLTKKLGELIEGDGSNLATIPGISTILAAKIVSHTNGIDRFKRVDQFVRYAGISPIERSSGKSKRYIKANRGNRKLNGTFYLSALTQICHNPKAIEYYQKKIKEGKTKKHGLRCVMKRTACIVYGMLKSGEDYRG